MIYIIIGLILVGIVLYIVGFFARKKYYTYIDKLESWKIEIMNRSAMEEVGKIKEVKMTGEAEECFEQWRKAWDRVISNDLPNVEEWLYDAEESVDKFRFSQAKEIFVKIEEGLKACETKIQKHVDQMQKVIESEEKNREEIQTIVETYKQLKKELLAHQHAFGKASVQLEKVIQAIKADIEKFELETEKGNYLTAREIVEALKNEINTLQNKMEHIPILLNDCVHIIPNQLKELKQGINDMTEEGYRLEHLGIEKELADIESQIKVYIEFLEAAEVKEVLAGLPEIKENLESIYQLLEEEVKAKQYVLTNRKKAEETLNKIDQTNAELTKEVEIVKISYHLSETDEKLLEQINKKIVTLKQSIKLLLDEKSISQSAYSIVKEKLETLLTELEEVETNQQLIEETLQELRKDEIEAREKIQTLKKQVQEATRLVTRSNIPGLPKGIEDHFLDAREAIQECFHLLEEKPLMMPSVIDSLDKTEEKVTTLYKKVVEMIENVYFIERIIQYGNRYRRGNPDLHEKLTKAEMAFRSFDYNLALELAAQAVEQVEPGAIKKIEELINQELKSKESENILILN